MKKQVQHCIAAADRTLCIIHPLSKHMVRCHEGSMFQVSVSIWFVKVRVSGQHVSLGVVWTAGKNPAVNRKGECMAFTLERTCTLSSSSVNSDQHGLKPGHLDRVVPGGLHHPRFFSICGGLVCLIDNHLEVQF